MHYRAALIAACLMIAIVVIGIFAGRAMAHGYDPHDANHNGYLDIKRQDNFHGHLRAAVNNYNSMHSRFPRAPKIRFVSKTSRADIVVRYGKSATFTPYEATPAVITVSRDSKHPVYALTHELGHAYGMKHHERGDGVRTIMHAYSGFNSLQRHDIRTLRGY